VVASVIDSLLIVVVLVPLLVFYYGLDFGGKAAGAATSDFAIHVIVGVACILFWRYWGATPGKMAISARIVDAKTGRAPSTGSLVARYVGYFVSTLPLMLGFAWIAIDRRKQGFHDKIAGTVVICDDD
jgi:uncharacterized RDD family membrane protein YckC